MPGNRQERNPYSLSPLLPWRMLSIPIVWDRVFGRSAPLSVELGFGLGDYLVRTALACPDTNFIGVEIDWFLIRRTLQKLTKARPTNVVLIHAGASMALRWLFSEQSVGQICALFPCPWPKARHAEKRLFSGSFLSLLNSRLAATGNAFVVTDDPEHARWIVDQATGTGFLVRTERISPQFDTRYEKEWEKRGQDHFYKICFQKETHHPVPAKEESPLQTRSVPYFHMEDLRPGTMKGQSTVVLKEALYDPLQERAMIRVLVIETDFFQDIWIEIVRKGPVWHIRPAKGCSMVPTLGVQEALDLLQARLLGNEEGSPSTDQPA